MPHSLHCNKLWPLIASLPKYLHWKFWGFFIKCLSGYKNSILSTRIFGPPIDLVIFLQLLQQSWGQTGHHSFFLILQ